MQTKELHAGMVVAQPIISDSGQILLDQGLPLTENLVKKLRELPVAGVEVVFPDEKYSQKPSFFSSYRETLDMVETTFERVRLFKEVPIAECREIVDNYIELMINVVDVMDSIFRMKSHNENAFRHSLNVAIIAGILGKWLGFAGQQLKDIILAGLLHDIGKSLIPRRILDKPGSLTNEEMEIVKKHPQQGYRFVLDCQELSRNVKLGIMQHHEREDGTGYPFGLHSGEIHVAAKIVAIADMYEAMTTSSVYHEKMSPFAALGVILEQMYEKLDTKICYTFITNLSRTMIGNTVLLSDGKRAKIVLFHDPLSLRPLVQLEHGAMLDLEQNGELTIAAVLEDTKAEGRANL
ncbi:hypothetical protein SATMO3_50160 [Sporomusa aerivorans]